MKKFLFLFLFFISVGLMAESSNAQQDIDKIINQIKNEQEIKDIKNIDISKVSENYLEKIGDLYMALMHHDKEIAECIDDMIDIKGSPSLENVHITMGYNYLYSLKNGGTGRFYSPMGYGMMSYGMNTKNNFGGWRMGWMMHGWAPWMGWNLFGLGGILMIFLILIPAGIIVYLLLRNKNGRNGFSQPTKDPIDILKERYAKGEITKDDFDKMKTDLIG